MGEAEDEIRDESDMRAVDEAGNESNRRAEKIAGGDDDVDLIKHKREVISKIDFALRMLNNPDINWRPSLFEETSTWVRTFTEEIAITDNFAEVDRIGND